MNKAHANCPTCGKDLIEREDGWFRCVECGDDYWWDDLVKLDMMREPNLLDQKRWSDLKEHNEQELENILDRHLMDNTFTFQEEEFREARKECERNWIGDSDPPQGHIMRLRLNDYLGGKFLIILRRLNLKKDVDWGYTRQEPVSEERGMTVYEGDGKAEFWLDVKGLRAFRDLLTYMEYAHTHERCSEELRLPIPEEDVREHWEKVHEEVEKDKQVLYKTLKKLELKAHPIVQAMLLPREDKEELTMPDKATFTKRLEEKMGVRVEDGLLEGMGLGFLRRDSEDPKDDQD